MSSKMVTTRQKRGRAVEAALETHGAEMARGVAERLAPLLEEGETVPEVAPVVILLQRLLGRQRQTLVEMDEAHLAELVTGQERRERRDLATEALVAQVIETRRLLEGAFGYEAAVRMTGLSGRTDRTPIEALRQGERLATRLRSPDLELPEDLHGGVQIDPLAVAGELEAPTRALRTALDDLDRFRREREVTLVAKGRTLEDFDATLAPVSLVVEGLLRLAGLEEFADRLRAYPPRRSSSSGSSPGDTEGSDGTEPEGEPAGADGAAGSGQPTDGDGNGATPDPDGDTTASSGGGGPGAGGDGASPPAATPGGPGGAATSS